MQGVKPTDKEQPIDPFILERIKMAADSIRKGEETYTLDEVFTELRNLIEEKSKNANTPNNYKQNSQERSS